MQGHTIREQKQIQFEKKGSKVKSHRASGKQNIEQTIQNQQKNRRGKNEENFGKQNNKRSSRTRKVLVLVQIW